MTVHNGQFTRTEGFAPGQDRNYPRFFVHDEQDMVASEREGRPIFRSEERVEIFMPGNPLTRPCSKVTQEHIQKWPEQYRAFKAGQEMSVDGTPLEQWALLRRSQVLELKALGLLTVEHVATMDDQALQRIPIGGRRLKELAKAYLDDAFAQAALSQKTAENDRLNERLAAQDAQIKELGRLLQETHTQLQVVRNAPDPIAATAPMMFDPVEQAKAGQSAEPPAQSSLANLPNLRGRRHREG